jgi:glyoxylase-like metal-dependent hydrolase (beta-lactamase superfamily II)
MDVVKIDSYATAFIRPLEGVNAGLIHTPKGMILIDTTSSPAEAVALLTAISASMSKVQMVVNTHFHSDHTWGNQVFKCPILAHRLCLERMKTALTNEWSLETFRSYLADLEKTNPEKADEFRTTLKDFTSHCQTRFLMNNLRQN